MNSISVAGWTFATVFAICELGENVTHRFNVFDEKLDDSDWFLYPIEMQRLFLIFLSGSQQPTIIQGYANTVCTRVAFKNVRFALVKRILG